VLLVISGYHTLKKCPGFISQGTGIKVDEQEYREYKANDNMQDIIKQQTADVKYRIGYFLREHKCNPGYNQDWHAQIHGHNIGYFLQGVKLLFLGDREWMGFTFKNAYGIEKKLFPEFGPKVFSPLSVIPAIACNHVTDDKNSIIDR
jgi:hypothetical protein